MPDIRLVTDNDGVKGLPSSDMLHLSQVEVRHLQSTIEVLRDELEKMQVSKQEAVQAAVASAHDEARQLQSTISALRGELEQKIFQHRDELERQKHAANEELRMLRQTIAALRDRMEKVRQ